MTALRAILGRLARFLVRIARTLDPGLAVSPQRVMPESMAALRLRYPGAPDHWLELFARRSIIPEPAPIQHAGEASGASDRASEFPAGGRTAGVMPDFQRPERRSRQWLRFPPAQSKPPAGTVAASAVARRTRPDVMIRTDEPRRRQNLVAPIGRISRRRQNDAQFRVEWRHPQPKFGPAGRDEPVWQHQPEDFDATREPAEASRELSWPAPPPVRRAGETTWRDTAPSARPVPHFPDLPARRAEHDVWASSAQRVHAPSASFPEIQGAWPELPPLLVDDDAGPFANADGAFHAEQVIGTWSE